MTGDTGSGIQVCFRRDCVYMLFSMAEGEWEELLSNATFSQTVFAVKTCDDLLVRSGSRAEEGCISRIAVLRRENWGYWGAVELWAPSASEYPSGFLSGEIRFEAASFYSFFCEEVMMIFGLGVK